ncbi:MAG: hypothetical protein NTX48_07185 [Planctomycetales bacterium]|nr:hypothetical protein [Planctomycetales bacterium]
MVSLKLGRWKVVAMILMFIAFGAGLQAQKANRPFGENEWLLAGANFSSHYCKDPMPNPGANTGCHVCQYHGEVYVEYMPGMGFLMKLWKRCDAPSDDSCVDLNPGVANRLCTLTETPCPEDGTGSWFQDASCSTTVAYGGANDACTSVPKYFKATASGVGGVSCAN